MMEPEWAWRLARHEPECRGPSFDPEGDLPAACAFGCVGDWPCDARVLGDALAAALARLAEVMA